MNFKSLSKSCQFKNVEYCEMINFFDNKTDTFYNDDFLDNHIKITLHDDRIIRIFENESECSIVEFYDKNDEKISSLDNDFVKLFIE